jgi:hypothetical protein
MLRTRGAAGDSLLYSDSFARFTATAQALESQPQGEQGDKVWANIGGLLKGQGANVFIGSQGGSAFYSHASGALHQDALAEIKLRSLGSVVTSASGTVELWVKGQGATVGVRAKWQLGPSQFLALLSHDGSATTLHASAGIASTLASGVYGNHHRLVARAQGNRVDVWVATGPLAASPVLSATHANFSLPGWPQLQSVRPSAAAAGLQIDDFSYSSLSAGASDIGPREWFRAESYPKRRVFQGNASVFVADREAEFRGNNPQIPPVGSPGASGPARIIVFAGDPDDFLGNDLLDVRVTVTERFKFLR